MLVDTTTQIQQAKQALGERRPVEAESILRGVLALQEDDFDALQLLGVACIHQNRTFDGIAALKRAANVRPSDAKAQFNLGSAYALAQRWHEANAAFQVALQIDPGYVRAREALSDVVQKQLAAAATQRANMDCVNHREVMSVDKCRQCGALVCEECVRMDYGTCFCPACYENVVAQREGIATRRRAAQSAAEAAEQGEKRGGLRGIFGRKSP